MKFHKILCPVDFSDPSADAARYAGSLAASEGAELTLLHIAPAVDFAFALAGPHQERLAEFTAHRDRTVRQALAAFPGGPALDGSPRRDIGHGDPASEIVRAARDGGHDLIVMSTHGLGAIRRWLLVGSVTTKVLQAAHCPVIAASDFAGRDAAIRRIVCALDLEPASGRVLCAAATLARRLDASLTLVHAAPPFGGAARDFVDPEWRATLGLRLREAVTGLQQQASAPGEVVIETGEPRAVVTAAARRAGADLIVVGRGVHNGLIGRLRAHAYDIIRNATCPVLTI
jgi:nucleotide-binding universal stress UspA family protein